ncbi:class I SAM-dependent methyltransferase [Mesorhizobium sp. B2-5-9]|uniref:class I SAM-dependent methyltransferase n=1 Tax=Mesorhizobium sp. B2-5-9 TaxID=2589921 RepID=UPI00112A9705|nr:class I SAM-dependent methyltransferase [Mesorhizobium sp. B2-5-9]TPJ99503.1 class I SAM-dependent methyltransferase [Mesorhizobium sp. B2-5-9]
MNADDLLRAVRQKAWSGRQFEPPAFFDRLPTMLTHEELCMLSFLSKNLGSDGIVLDLGCFVGGSTLALAHGIRRSSNPQRHIHSFDLFELNDVAKYRFIYSCGLPFFPGNDGLLLYSLITKGVAENVTPHPGNVLHTLVPSSPPVRQPISLVFLDLCKSPAITDHITRTVFPLLEPGALIVQQDFIYEFAPWVIYPFWALRRHFTFAGYTTRHSAIFQVSSPIPSNEIESGCVSDVSSQQIERSIEEVSKWFPYRGQRDTLDAARQIASEFPQCRDEWSLMQSWRRKNNMPDPLAEWQKLDWGVDRH